jgi:tetratricopeptide (TPR) repeat protein
MAGRARRALVAAARAGLVALLAAALALAGLELALRAAGAAVSLSRRARVLFVSRDKVRVVCLGESTTFGAATSYPAELEKLLNASSPRYAVFNLGLSGGRTDDILHELEADLDLYRPDVVVAMMGVNDAGPVSELLQKARASRTRVGRLLSLGWSGLFAPPSPSDGAGVLARRADAARRLRAAARARLDAGRPRTAWLLLRAARVALGRPDDSARLGLAACALARGRPEEAKRLFEARAHWTSQDHADYLSAARGLHMRRSKPTMEETGLLDKALLADDERRAWLALLEKRFAAAGLPETAAAARDEERAAEAMSAVLVARRAKRCWEASRDAGCVQGLEAELARRQRAGGGLEPAPARARVSTAWELAGELAAERGDRAAAETCLARALALAPANEHAAEQLAAALSARGDWQRARTVLEASAASAPQEPSRLERLAAFEEGRGRGARAAGLRTRAAALAAPLPEATARNYRRLADALERRGVPLVCLAYPTQRADALRRLLAGRPGIVFADDEDGFRQEIRRSGPEAVFTDLFAGGFGHCTPLGYRLLARNALGAVLEAARAGRRGRPAPGR